MSAPTLHTRRRYEAWARSAASPPRGGGPGAGAAAREEREREREREREGEETGRCRMVQSVIQSIAE